MALGLLFAAGRALLGGGMAVARTIPTIGIAAARTLPSIGRAAGPMMGYGLGSVVLGMGMESGLRSVGGGIRGMLGLPEPTPEAQADTGLPAGAGTQAVGMYPLAISETPSGQLYMMQPQPQGISSVEPPAAGGIFGEIGAGIEGIVKPVAIIGAVLIGGYLVLKIAGKM